MGFTYEDKGKTMLHTWGRFRVTVSEDVIRGDLLSFLNTGTSNTVQLANESDSQAADCIASEDGEAGDEIWACLKAEIKAPVTIATGGVATQTYFAGSDDWFGAPLYLSSTDGEPEDTAGTTYSQVVGRLLARDRILFDLHPNYGVDAKGQDFKVFGANTLAYMLWDSSADQLILRATPDAVEEIGTYQALLDLTIAFDAAIASKWVCGAYIGIEGSGTLTGELYGLWLDWNFKGTGTSGTSYIINMSNNSGSHVSNGPTAFMRCYGVAQFWADINSTGDMADETATCGTTAEGIIKVRVDGSTRRIKLYSD